MDFNLNACTTKWYMLWETHFGFSHFYCTTVCGVEYILRKRMGCEKTMSVRSQVWMCRLNCFMVCWGVYLWRIWCPYNKFNISKICQSKKDASDLQHGDQLQNHWHFCNLICYQQRQLHRDVNIFNLTWPCFRNYIYILQIFNCVLRDFFFLNQCSEGIFWTNCKIFFTTLSLKIVKTETFWWQWMGTWIYSTKSCNVNLTF